MHPPTFLQGTLPPPFLLLSPSSRLHFIQGGKIESICSLSHFNSLWYLAEFTPSSPSRCLFLSLPSHTLPLPPFLSSFNPWSPLSSSSSLSPLPSNFPFPPFQPYHRHPLPHSPTHSTPLISLSLPPASLFHSCIAPPSVLVIHTKAKTGNSSGHKGSPHEPVC